MATIDEEVKRLLEECPILFDEEFQKKHPGVVNVAGFLDSCAKTHYRMMGKFKPFDKLRVRDISGYLAKLQEGDIEAVGIYETVRNTFGFE